LPRLCIPLGGNKIKGKLKTELIIIGEFSKVMLRAKTIEVLFFSTGSKAMLILYRFQTKTVPYRFRIKME